MALDSGHPLDSLAADGGLSASDLCMQTQADVAGIPVLRPCVPEATSLGAALAAGLAVGVWKDVGGFPRVGDGGTVLFRPAIGGEERERRRGCGRGLLA
ncbi:glycerol kinase [Ophiocordyceps camponoti-floridani]|uniref:Glycerol kinase n=1 Tax=Ophiocordyceps camponoti-floridani TaxID=2030778 RepID=A0A8H4QE95_9HYPO|nr:glycerol kinase [Ophiocordyceps camponoti-floridani]